MMDLRSESSPQTTAVPGDKGGHGLRRTPRGARRRRRVPAVFHNNFVFIPVRQPTIFNKGRQPAGHLTCVAALTSEVVLEYSSTGSGCDPASSPRAPLTAILTLKQPSVVFQKEPVLESAELITSRFTGAGFCLPSTEKHGPKGTQQEPQTPLSPERRRIPCDFQRTSLAGLALDSATSSGHGRAPRFSMQDPIQAPPGATRQAGLYTS
ncbi:hypothetical protein TNCV_702001 [Trichonephila clavipes]|nr:hypothetical protein TNCV_702001 [Trichonephila clavipes]